MDDDGAAMNDDGKADPPLTIITDWRELAALASEERDPERLLQLVKQLGDQLDQDERIKKRPPNFAAELAGSRPAQ